MQSEELKTFTPEGRYLADVPRDKVHVEGLWHETFHCWFVSQKDGKTIVHFQLRSKNKKDFPDMLDISAAGHILASEDVADGIREVHEELGIELSLDELEYAGRIPDVIVQNNFIDHEFAHTYFYLVPENSTLDYSFQAEEVAGMIDIELSLFELLWKGTLKSITVNGVILDKDQKLTETTLVVTKSSFVPHKDRYIDTVIKHIKLTFCTLSHSSSSKSLIKVCG